MLQSSVLYTINAAPTAVAAGDATICESNNTYQLLSTVSNSNSITWTSTGSGSFDNVNVEDPIYTLSPGDKTSGSVSFTVTASQPAGCAADSDTMVLTIQKNPIAMRGRHPKFVKASPLQFLSNHTIFKFNQLDSKWWSRNFY